jgi:hypothetical protein
VGLRRTHKHEGLTATKSIAFALRKWCIDSILAFLYSKQFVFPLGFLNRIRDSLYISIPLLFFSATCRSFWTVRLPWHNLVLGWKGVPGQLEPLFVKTTQWNDIPNNWCLNSNSSHKHIPLTMDLVLSLKYWLLQEIKVHDWQDWVEPTFRGMGLA